MAYTWRDLADNVTEKSNNIAVNMPTGQAQLSGIARQNRLQLFALSQILDVHLIDTGQNWWVVSHHDGWLTTVSLQFFRQK